MALQNLADHLKTTPTNAPPSLGAVRNQLRFWGMGQNMGSGRALPQLQADMGKYNLNATTHLAELQRRASEMQIGAERSMMAVNAGMAEDNSALAHKRMDLQEQSQEEDILGLASRATAGLIGLGRATRVVASASGLKGVQNFLEKMPLIGKSKKIRQAEELQNKMLDAYENGNIDDIERHSEYLNMYGQTMATLANLKTVIAEQFPNADIESLFPDVGLEDRFNQLGVEFRGMLRNAGFSDNFNMSWRR